MSSIKWHDVIALTVAAVGVTVPACTTHKLLIDYASRFLKAMENSGAGGDVAGVGRDRANRLGEQQSPGHERAAQRATGQSADCDEELGGIRESPTCQELALEGEAMTKRGEYNEAIPVLESAIAVGTEDYQLLSILWSLLGRCHYNRGCYERASQSHIHDLAITLQSGDDKGQCQAYCNLGIVFRKLGHLSRAFVCFQKQLSLARKIFDESSIQKAYFNIGEVHLLLGRLALGISGRVDQIPVAKENLEQCASYLETHLKHILTMKQRFTQEKTLFFLGQTYELLKDYDKAMDYYQQCLSVAIQEKDRGTEGRMYCNMGNCLRAIIELEKAKECYDRALKIAGELQDRIGEAVVCANLGSNYEMLGDITSALEYHQKHLDVMKTTSDKVGESLALKNVARTLEYKGQIGRACEVWHELAIVYRDLKKEEEMFETLTRIARLSEMPSSGQYRNRASSILGSLRRLKYHFSKASESSRSSQSTTQGADSASGSSSQYKGAIERNAIENRSRSPFVNRRSQIDGLRHADKRKSASLEALKETSSLVKSPPPTAKECHPSACKEAWTVRKTESVIDREEKAKVVELQTDVPCPPGGSSTALTGAEDVSTLYDNFGDHSHQAEVKRVNKMLDSNKLLLDGPSDLSLLLDWSGWMLAPKEIVIHKTHESRLI